MREKQTSLNPGFLAGVTAWMGMTPNREYMSKGQFRS